MNRTIQKWNCDSPECFEEVHLSRYGLPDGWMWLRRDGEVHHACQDCTPELKKDGWGVAKSDPTQLTNIPGQFVAETP